MNGKFKKTMSSLLAASMLASTMPMALAEGPDNYLPEMAVDEAIVESGNFYISTESAIIDENNSNPYLFKVQRGGTSLPAASVVLSMLDITANYGKDYKIKLHDSGLFDEKVDVPDDNVSILDTILEDPDSVQETNYSDLIVSGEISSEEDIEKLVEEDLET